MHMHMCMHMYSTQSYPLINAHRSCHENLGRARACAARMLIPNLRTPPASAATAPVLTGAVQRWGTALLAASVLSSTPFTPPAFAATPTPTELSRIAEGLARIDYLLDNWDKLTTVCKGTPDELESKQTVKIVDGLGGTRCTKSPLIVQKFIGAG